MRRRIFSLVAVGALVFASVVAGPTSSAAPDLEASISGTVTWPEGFTPMASANVTAYAADEIGASFPNPAAGSALISADGAYTIAGLDAGREYIVWVSPSFTPDGLMGAVYKDFSTLDPGPSIWQTGDSVEGIDYVTTSVDGGRVDGIDIALQAEAEISGTILTPDGSPLIPALGPDGQSTALVFCQTLTPDGSAEPLESASHLVVDVDENGHYSCAAEPGKPYAVSVDVPGYPRAWLGTQVGLTILPDADVDIVGPLDPGETLAGQNITLVEGSTISGKITFDLSEGGQTSVAVGMCQLLSDGQKGDCTAVSYLSDTASEPTATGFLNADGTYTLTGVAAGETYVVSASGLGYVETYYGGYLGYPSDYMGIETVTKVEGAPSGEDYPGVDITLARTVTITGTILPTDLELDGYPYVWACPTFIEDGDPYYRSGTTMGWGDSRDPLPFDDTSTHGGDTTMQCLYADILPGEKTYTLDIVPNTDYVIFGEVDGHTTVWYGTYLGDSHLVIGDSKPITPLPDSDLIRTVNGAPGETIEGVDLVFEGAVRVTFDADGGEPATQQVGTASGSTVPLPPAPTREGFVFGGWFTEPGGAGVEFGVDSPVTADVTLYAMWTEVVVPPVETFTVSYDANGGVGSLVDLTVYESGDVATAPSGGFTREGFSFVGWNTVAGGTGTAVPAGGVFTVTGDMTLYAMWEKIVVPAVETFTVTFDADGGVPTPAPVEVEEGDTIAFPPAPTREGFVFGGWFTEPGGAGVEFGVDSPVTADVTVFAMWTEVVVPPVETFTVSYDANGGVGSLVDELVYESGDVATAPSGGFTREGFSFVGWNTVAGGTGTAVPAGGVFTVTGDMTLYAMWEKIVISYDHLIITQVTSEIFAGTGEPGSSISVTYQTADGWQATLVLTVAADGTWSAPTPPDAASGEVTVIMTTPTGIVEVATADLTIVTVSVPPTTTPDGTTPAGTITISTGGVVSSGANTWPVLVLAGLLVLGGVAVVRGRRTVR